jgi:hypothetical protein
MANPEMDALLDEALNAATYLLNKNGEFFPFGVTMSPNGKTNHVMGYTGEEQPGSQELIDLLLAGFLQGARKGEYRATALVSDVRVSLDGASTTDAISVTIEHAEDEPVTCLLPYQNRQGQFEFGELVAGNADRHVFVR